LTAARAKRFTARSAGKYHGILQTLPKNFLLKNFNFKPEKRGRILHNYLIVYRILFYLRLEWILLLILPLDLV
jgi:hypothetical protein